jgi:hypothetical protein
VSLYADEDGTATLAGAGLPAVEAAAAMARITALARAMKAAGQGGGLDLHRARVMLGLLLGTLPYIPPPGGAPEPEPPGDGDHPGGGPGPGPADRNGRRPTGPDGGQPDDLPDPRDEDAPPGDGSDDNLPGDSPDGDGREPGDEDDDLPEAGPVPPWPGLGAIAPGLLGRIGPSPPPRPARSPPPPRTRASSSPTPPGTSFARRVRVQMQIT